MLQRRTPCPFRGRIAPHDRDPQGPPARNLRLVHVRFRQPGLHAADHHGDLRRPVHAHHRRRRPGLPPRQSAVEPCPVPELPAGGRQRSAAGRHHGPGAGKKTHAVRQLPAHGSEHGAALLCRTRPGVAGVRVDRGVEHRLFGGRILHRKLPALPRRASRTRAHFRPRLGARLCGRTGVGGLRAGFSG